MICTGCLEDVSDAQIAHEDGDDLYCRDCWPRYEKTARARNARDRALGHTGTDLCGCSVCAAKADHGEF